MANPSLHDLVRCPICTECVPIDDLSSHLCGHSTWTVLRHSFKQWPLWTAGLVTAALLFVAYVTAVLIQSGWWL